MSDSRWKVGIVGLQPGRSWAARAHVPALHALSDTFEILGVANTNRASADEAAAATGLPRGFASVAEMLATPGLDIVTVAVKVPDHFEVVKAALDAGKNVYCEWPLGNGLAEAVELASLARSRGLIGVVGTQARVAPEIVHARQLISDGFIGELLATSVVANGGGWGGAIPEKKNNAYLLDRTNGATLLTIPLGHALGALTEVLGDVAEVSAVLATRRKTAVVLDSGETLPMSAPDQVLVSGVMATGAPISIHYRGGMAREGKGFTWEINGTRGDIRITAAFGHPQLLQLSLEGAQGTEASFRHLAIPESTGPAFPKEVGPGNVARAYARMANDLREGTRTAPTFDDAVKLHRIINAIEKASQSGRRTKTA